jgi:hypothetical protein
MFIPGMEESSCLVLGVDAEADGMSIPGVEEWLEEWEPQAARASARAPLSDAATTARRREEKRETRDMRVSSG